MNFEQKLQLPVTEKEKVIITGGTEGIGRAIALELAKQDNDVVICARTQERLDEMQSINNIEACQLDLSDTDKIDAFVKEGSKKIGGATILILNAAVTGIRDSHDYTFKVVRDAPKAVVDSAAELLRSSNGRIVFITSAQAKKFVEGHEHYGQAKKDVEDYLQEFSNKEENKNIEIFLVNPGSVDTRMNEEVLNYGVGAIRERSLNAKNLGKFRSPEIVGRIISKMSLSGKQYNPETKQYDIPIEKNEIVAISDENVEFEKIIIE